MNVKKLIVTLLCMFIIFNSFSVTAYSEELTADGSDNINYIEETITQSSYIKTGTGILFSLTTVVYNPGNGYRYRRTVSNSFSGDSQGYYYVPTSAVSVTFSSDFSTCYVSSFGYILNMNDSSYSENYSFSLTFYAN